MQKKSKQKKTNKKNLPESEEDMQEKVEELAQDMSTLEINPPAENELMDSDEVIDIDIEKADVRIEPTADQIRAAETAFTKFDSAGTAEPSIMSALAQFIAVETLDDEDSFACENCHKILFGGGKFVLRPARKRFLIEEAPEVLVLHLKRFRQVGRRSIKVDFRVTFPEVLDLHPYLNSKNAADEDKYRLCAVIEHSGSLNAGHYVAYVRRDSSWVYCSDTHIRPVSLQQVLDSQAYILLYNKLLH